MVKNSDFTADNDDESGDNHKAYLVTLFSCIIVALGIGLASGTVFGHNRGVTRNLKEISSANAKLQEVEHSFTQQVAELNSVKSDISDLTLKHVAAKSSLERANLDVAKLTACGAESQRTASDLAASNLRLTTLTVKHEVALALIAKMNEKIELDIAVKKRHDMEIKDSRAANSEKAKIVINEYILTVEFEQRNTFINAMNSIRIICDEHKKNNYSCCASCTFDW